MISALAARKAAAQTATQPAPSTASSSTVPATPSSKPNSKRKPRVSEDGTSAQRKKAKTAKGSKDASESREENVNAFKKPSSKRQTSSVSQKPASKGKPQSKGKPTSKRSQPQRYFATPLQAEDSFKQGNDVIELPSGSESESSDEVDGEGEYGSSDDESVDEDGYTYAVSAKSRKPKSEASSSEDEDMDVDLTVLASTTFSTIPSTGASLPPAVSTTPPKLTTFEPILEENVFPLTPAECASLGLSRSPDSSLRTSLVVLPSHESLCVLGTCSLRVLHRSFTMLGTRLDAEDVTQHRIFAPSSAPLPVIRCAFSKRTTSPLPQNLPSRVQCALEEDASAALLALQSLPTGVEGLGTVCRPFEGIWEGSKWQRGVNAEMGIKEVKEPLGIPGLSVVYYQSRDIQPFVLPQSWTAGLASTLEQQTYLVKGPRNSGKSTFARTLLNQLLSQYERVAYLECDPGQGEFCVGGVIGLNVVTDPILGPPFTHLTIPQYAHFVGATTPRSSPDFYLEAVQALVEKYRAEVQSPSSAYSGSYDEDDGEDEDMVDGTEQNQTRRKDFVPLIVNTMGWTKGLGADLNRQIEEWVDPACIFDFDNPAYSDELSDPTTSRDAAPVSINGMSWGAFAGAGHSGGSSMGTIMSNPGGQGEAGGKKVIVLQPPVGATDEGMKKYTAADYRTLSLMSWFYGHFSSPSSSRATPTITSWSTSLPLLARPPLEIDISQTIDQVALVGAGYEDVVPSELGRCLNGAVVGLVRRDDNSLNENALKHSDASSATPALARIYQQGVPPPSPYTSTCVGLALVRAVAPHLIDSPSYPSSTEDIGDAPKDALQLLTPVPPTSLSAATVLVKGELELPVWGMLDHRAWSRDPRGGASDAVVDETSQPPYLQWGRDMSGAIGGDKKRVRRNLMRRGQQ